MRWLRAASLLLGAACSRSGTEDRPSPARASCDVKAVDRALALLRMGDGDGARRSAAAARHCPASARGLALQSALALDEGRIDDAIARAREALALDARDPAVLLEAADALHARRSFDEAAALAERAARSSAGAARDDARLLVAEIRFEADMPARDVLETLPPAASLGVREALRAGRLWLELGEGARAEAYLRRAMRDRGKLSTELRAELHYQMALCHDRAGRSAEKIAEFRQVWRLEHDAPPAGLHLARAGFESLVRDQIAVLPPDERRLLERVTVSVAEYPAAEIVAEGFDPRSLGLFTGDADATGQRRPAVPGAIFLYQANLEAVARDEEDLRREVHRTLLHELGHFRGMSEEDLRAARLQ